MVIVLSLFLFSFLIIQFLQLTTKVGGEEEEVWIQSLVLMKETKLCHCARQKLKYNSLMLQCTSVPADE